MPTTRSVTLVDLDDLLPLLPGATLGAAAVDLSLLEAHVKAPLALGTDGDIRFDAAAGGEVALTVVSASHPVDPDGIVAAKDAVTPSGQLAPHLRIDRDGAWVKYTVAAQASVAGAGRAGWFGLEAGMSRAVVCADYRRHHKDVVIASALERDLRSGPRVAISLDDVLGLAPGDAVSFEIAGELHARVTLSWSDVFTSQMGTLTRAVATTAPIGISVEAGGSVSAAVRVSDTFLLVFSRADAKRWRVGLRKAGARQVDFGAGAGLAVAFDRPEEVAGVLAGVLTNLLGMAYDRVRALVERSSLAQVDLGPFSGVFERLGISDTPTLPELREALQRLEETVRSRLETVVREKVTLAFGYEYRRVSSDTMLIQALLTRPALEAHHRALAGGSLTTIVPAALAQPRPEGPIIVEQYLNERSVRTSRSVGFTLGIGKWELSGRDRRELTVVRRLTLDGQHEQRSYAGFGAYTGNVFGEKKTWQVDFAADMPQYSVGPVPTLSEYQFGVMLRIEERNRTFDDGDSEQASDLAVLWSVCGARGAAVLRGLLQPFRRRRGVEWSVQLRINDEAWRLILPLLAEGGRGQFAAPMAAALRTRRGIGIADVGRRRALYAPVWAFYLDSAQAPSVSDVAAVAHRHLRQEDPITARWEADHRKIDGLLTAAGTCALNTRTREDVDDFLRGVRVLSTAVGRNEPDLGIVQGAYSKMRTLWLQSHHVRALGVRFLDAAAATHSLKGVERTLSVIADGHALVVSSNPAEGS